MSKKDVIYIDIEDDITSIIEKVKKSKADIVALVPPKRSTVLQSAVNMKLLKKTGTDADKKVVLISSESSLKPLAGGVGLFMADSLQSRPQVPEVEDAKIDDSIIEDDEGESDSKAGAVAAGAAVGAAAAKSASKKEDATEAKSGSKGKKTGKAKKGDEKSEKIDSLKGKSKIPNFQKFRWRLIFIIGGIIGLIVLWFLAFRVFPSAEIEIKAQTTRVPTDTTFIADTGSATDLDKGVLRADEKTLTESKSEDFEATGEKDVGQKAAGSMTVQNCDSSTAITVPAGTVFKDGSSGFTFTSDTRVEVPGGVFSGGGCSTPGEADVDVTASESGDDKNLSPRSYSVGNYGGTVTAFGDQMSGGTTKIVKVVSQQDIDQAVDKLLSNSSDPEKDNLVSQFDDSSYVLTSSFTVSNEQPSSQPKAGSESNTGTVTAQFTYTMLGVSNDDINSYLEKVQKDELGGQSDQSILDTGLGSATISKTDQVSNSNMTFQLKTNGFAGPELDIDALKEEIKGMRFSEAVATIEGKDGVNSVDINLSPFYVSHVPNNTGKINISIEVSDHTLQ